MIVERVEVINKLLIVLHLQVGLRLFDLCYLLLVTAQLLLDFLDDSFVVLYLCFLLLGFGHIITLSFLFLLVLILILFLLVIAN